MQVQVGVRVRVPFGKRELIGIVWQLDPENAHPDKLKALLEVLDQTPLFGNEIKQLLSFAADYYHHPLGEVLVSALPALLREGKAVLAGHGRLLQLTPLGSSLKTDALQRAPRQLALWQRLQQAACREDELVGESPQIKALLEKDLVAWQAIEFMPFTYHSLTGRHHYSSILRKHWLSALSISRPAVLVGFCWKVLPAPVKPKSTCNVSARCCSAANKCWCWYRKLA